MNSGQDADPDLPDTEAPDNDAAVDPHTDSESLQRSRDAIDQGHEAAREALKDNRPEAEEDTSAQSEGEVGR
jgi:hypothetical protein